METKRKNHMPKKLRAATEKVNRYGFRLLMSGARLDNYKANPVMLLNHNWGMMSLGKFDLEMANGELLAMPEFDMDDKEAKKLATKYEKGYMAGLSVGLFPLAWSEEPELMLPGQTLPTVTEWELVEISCATVPADAGAVSLYTRKEDGQYQQLTADNITLAFSSNNLNTDMKDLKELLALLGLGDTATKAEAIAAVQQLQANSKKPVGDIANKLGLEDGATLEQITAKLDEVTTTIATLTAEAKKAKETHVSISQVLEEAKKLGIAVAEKKPEGSADGALTLAQKYYDLSKQGKGEGLKTLKATDPEQYQKLQDAYLSNYNLVKK